MDFHGAQKSVCFCDGRSSVQTGDQFPRQYTIVIACIAIIAGKTSDWIVLAPGRYFLDLFPGYRVSNSTVWLGRVFFRAVSEVQGFKCVVGHLCRVAF